MTTIPRPIRDLDVDLHELQRRIAKERVERSVERLRWLLAHPEAVAQGKPASDGEAAEMRHWLYDADADATVPAFPYPNAATQEAAS